MQQNNNKYYMIQLLECTANKTYLVWFRWGRVGKDGQTTAEACGSDLERAKTLFCRKFADKTRNEWAARAHFEKVYGKYDLILRDYAEEEEAAAAAAAKPKKEEEEEADKPVPPSKLDKRVQELIQLICNVREMEALLKEMKYD